MTTQPKRKWKIGNKDGVNDSCWVLYCIGSETPMVFYSIDWNSRTSPSKNPNLGRKRLLSFFAAKGYDKAYLYTADDWSAKAKPSEVWMAGGKVETYQAPIPTPTTPIFLFHIIPNKEEQARRVNEKKKATLYLDSNGKTPESCISGVADFVRKHFSTTLFRVDCYQNGAKVGSIDHFLNYTKIV